MLNKFSAEKPLSATDAENPYHIIDVFFDRYAAANSQRYIWELLTAAFSSQDIDYWDRLERSNAVYFCHNLSDLLEAAYIIHKQQKGR